jgi:hypothetical protein
MGGNVKTTLLYQVASRIKDVTPEECLPVHASPLYLKSEARAAVSGVIDWLVERGKSKLARILSKELEEDGCQMESFSQCPGEVYDIFNDVDESEEISLHDLVSGLKESVWYKENTKFKVSFSKKDSTTIEHCLYENMQIAIAEANLLIAKGYTVESITTEYPSILDFQGLTCPPIRASLEES